MNQNIVALSVGVHRDHLHSHKIYQDGHKTRIYTLARNLRGRKHGLQTPNEGINQRYLKNWADEADKICFGRT